MTRTRAWAIICGGAAGGIMGWALGSTPIGIGVVIVVGAATAYFVNRNQRPHIH